MTPYMSFLSQPFIDVLKSPLKSAGDQELWLVIIQTLTKSLTQDQGGNRLRSISISSNLTSLFSLLAR